MDTDPKKDQQEYDDVLTSYYQDDQQVMAMITLKVDTKYADDIAATVAGFEPAEDVFMVTGDIDVILKCRFVSYGDLKKFIVSKLGTIRGVKETKTLMVVTAYKEGGKLTPDEVEEEEEE